VGGGGVGNYGLERGISALGGSGEGCEDPRLGGGRVYDNVVVFLASIKYNAIINKCYSIIIIIRYINLRRYTYIMIKNI